MHLYVLLLSIQPLPESFLGGYLFIFLLILELKDIASLIETGAYTREVRRIVRAIRWTIQLRKKLTASAVHAFLSSVLLPGSEVQTRLSSYVPKVSMPDIWLKFCNSLWKICCSPCIILIDE